MSATNWALVFGALFATGILVKLCIHVIENKFARGIVVIIVLGVLAVTEHAIFDLAIPAGKEEMTRQINECAEGYYNPGCPGYPPPWQSSSP